MMRNGKWQIASRNFVEEEIIQRQANNEITMRSLFNHYPKMGSYSIPADPDGYTRYSLVNLNGMANFTIEDNGVGSLFARDNSLNFYLALFQTRHINPMLSFAWEHDAPKRLKLALPIALRMIEDSEILVIIGYSFPFFNRDIDKKIMETLLKSVNTIYYQDPYNNGSFLKSQFDISKDITWIEKVSQFFIPRDL
jgi:hypothetical protein